MKKFAKITTVALATTMLATGVTACTSGGNSKKYEGREKISVSIFFGEYGIDWLKNIATEWNDTQTDKYYVDVKGDLNMANTVSANIKSGSSYDMFIMEDCGFQSLYKNGYLEDLSDVLQEKPDGTKTVQEKIVDYSTWQKVASYDGKTYMLPFNTSPVGFIYDHDRFVQNGWLLKDADGTLTAGKDGKKGTYDDGQPQTEDEFYNMLDKIKSKTRDDVFCYMGATNADYVDNVGYAYLAQYLGEEKYQMFLQHDTNGQEIELTDGTRKVVSIEEGYETFRIKGMEKMADFINDLTSSDYASEKTRTDRSFTVDASHTAFIEDKDNAPAFLIEGNWWENGSRQLFDSPYISKNFGETDYRYMLLPTLDGQTSTKSYIFSQTGGAIVVPKKNDEKKTSAIKDFIKFMLKDENMAKVTVDTGMIWNYDYAMTEDQKAQLTPFIKNTYNLVADTENVVVRSRFIDACSSPIYAYSALGAKGLIYGKDGQTILTMAYTTAGNTNTFLSQIVDRVKAGWTGYVETAKSYGFYK